MSKLINNEDEDSDSFFTNNANPNDDYYEEIDENFYSNKSEIYNQSGYSRVLFLGGKKSNLKRQSASTTRSRADSKLSKIRTVPMKYENNNYFNVEGNEKKKKKLNQQSEPNDSLNNLDLSIDTENLAILKTEPKVIRKAAANSVDSTQEKLPKIPSGEEKILKGDSMSRTYEEIMQINNLDYTDEPKSVSRHKNDQYNKSHYRITNQSSNIISRRHRSSSSSNASSSRRNFNPSVNNNSHRRHLSTSGVVAFESASVMSTDENLSIGNASNHASASIYGVRLGKYSLV